MNPLRLAARNYRSFVQLELDFPSGCIAIVGENGAGKSSIVNAIELALFGARNLGDYVTEDRPDEQLELALEFEHRGELYRVRRSRKKNATKVDFEHQFDGDPDGPPMPEWEPLTRETAAATQALIEETIGISRETFRASAFLAQGDGAAFTEAQPRERKAILAEVLGLEVWDELLARARADKAQVETKLGIARQRITSATEQLAEQAGLELQRTALGARAQELQDGISGLEARKTELENAIGGAEENRARLAEAKDALVARAQVAESVTGRLDEIGATLRPPDPRWLDKAEALQAELEEAMRRQGAEAEYRRLFFERQRLLGEANEGDEQAHAIREEAKLLEENGPGSTTCAVCNQTLGAEALAATLVSMRERADRLAATAAEKDKAAKAIELPEYAPATGRSVEDIQPELRLAHEAEAQRARAEAALEERARLTAQLPELDLHVKSARARVEALERDVPDLAKLETERVDVVRELREGRLQIDGARGNLIRAEHRLEQLAVLQAQRIADEAEAEQLDDQLDVLLTCERAYGRNGIPTMIVENAAVPQIELEANRILAELGTSFTVELHTQREKKDGGIAEALDIVVAGPMGARPYETFSGGERTRLNLALRIALARLLAHRRGAEVRLLVIDEPEFLDEAGVSRLAEVLRGLSTDFERVFLISHQPALRDAFDEVLTIVKQNDRSRVDELAIAEEVAA